MTARFPCINGAKSPAISVLSQSICVTYKECATKRIESLKSPEAGLSKGPTSTNFGGVVGRMQGFKSRGIGFDN